MFLTTEQVERLNRLTICLVELLDRDAEQGGFAAQISDAADKLAVTWMLVALGNAQQVERTRELKLAIADLNDGDYEDLNEGTQERVRRLLQAAAAVMSGGA